MARGCVVIAVGALCALIATGDAFDADAPLPVASPQAGAGGGKATPSADACEQAARAWGDAAKAQVDLSLDHPRQLVDGLVAAREALGSAEPPAAIASSWTIFETDVTILANAVEQVGPDNRTALANALDKATKRIDPQEMTQAAAAVTAYFENGCKK